ncbi:hypothetical protein QR680_006373 [Steinernema hermaphroditum]|uniref:TIL domain-containing protein n=1 Tax=Steinernema hermaphroditum TaxID=289476 RepID=A0AA39LXA7_9BILA|nr:hypothetical protein QR680_006373 [Steinernema hermaphroditum]
MFPFCLTVCLLLLIADVSSLGCGTNETFSTCHSACPQTCDPDSWTATCPFACRKGCGCPYEFVMHEGGCMHVRDCPDIVVVPSETHNEIRATRTKIGIFNRR